MTSTIGEKEKQRMALGAAKAASRQKNAEKPPAVVQENVPRKGGVDRKKASVAPPAEVPALKSGPSNEVEKINMGRLIFPASEDLMARIDAYWHKHGLPSKSAAIRSLIEKSLK